MKRTEGRILRQRILTFLSANPGQRITAIARGVGLAGRSPALECHLATLEQRGLIRQCDLLRWWPTSGGGNP